MVEHLGIGILSFECSVGSGFFNCGGSIGGFGGENGL